MRKELLRQGLCNLALSSVCADQLMEIIIGYAHTKPARAHAEPPLSSAVEKRLLACLLVCLFG